MVATVAVDFARAGSPADYQLQNGAQRCKRDDYYEVQAQGGFRFVVDALGLTVAESLLILHDLETMQEAIDQVGNADSDRVCRPSTRRRPAELSASASNGPPPSASRSAAPNAVDACPAVVPLPVLRG